MRICVDAGHGGRDPGAVGRDPFLLREKDFNLDLAERLEGHLRERGWHPLLTRRADRSLSPASRAAFANRLDADLFLSLHANAAAVPEAEGMEVFCFPGSRRGAVLGRQLLDHLLARFPGHRDRGVKEADFAVLRLTRMPAVLVEHEFLTNPSQLRFLAEPQTRDGIAAVLAAGVAAAAAELGLSHQGWIFVP
ncbi:MAG TPA: N-acetylmuramoyl-L-alanine amidase [Thermoanaerobaculia bacterium]|nr:N-acetylmuramoyl-L-alanine amidase [Thermoanaerobaculia bacterium]